MSADELENRNFLARPVVYAMGVVLLVAVGVAPLRAQDLAEAARQARERKAAQQNNPHHVYNDDDLKRSKILTPEDTSRAVASRQAPSSSAKPEIQAATKQPEENQQQPEPPSLGEVARRYRLEKQARQAEQAMKVVPPSRYPLDLPKASFAVPRVGAAPPSGSLREDELHPPRPKVPYAAPPAGAARISPFAPRRDVPSRSPYVAVPLASIAASLQRRQVQDGESWWRLAQRYLGNGSRWPELLRVNPGINPRPTRLKAGTFVFVPLGANPHKGPPGPKIVVRAGDSLWSLAREHLGCGRAWPQLAAANPAVTNFHQLQIGAKLRIPDGAAAVCPAK